MVAYNLLSLTHPNPSPPPNSTKPGKRFSDKLFLNPLPTLTQHLDYFHSRSSMVQWYTLYTSLDGTNTVQKGQGGLPFSMGIRVAQQFDTDPRIVREMVIRVVIMVLSHILIGFRYTTLLWDEPRDSCAGRLIFETGSFHLVKDEKCIRIRSWCITQHLIYHLRQFISRWLEEVIYNWIQPQNSTPCSFYSASSRFACKYKHIEMRLGWNITLQRYLKQTILKFR